MALSRRKNQLSAASAKSVRQPSLVRSRARRAGVDGESKSIHDAVVALKREWIVAAAVELFDARGYEATTLDAVAEKLGVTKPFIYLYFKSKSDLLAEICSRGIGYSLRAARQFIMTDQSPTEQIRAFGREFVLAVLENQKHVAIFNREEKNLNPSDLKRINGMRRAFDRILTGLLERGAATGEFRLKDPRIASLAIGGMVSWAYVWYRPSGRLSREDVANRLNELIFALVQGADVAADAAAPTNEQRAKDRRGAALT